MTSAPAQPPIRWADGVEETRVLDADGEYVALRRTSLSPPTTLYRVADLPELGVGVYVEDTPPPLPIGGHGGATHSTLDGLMRNVTAIVVHCSDSPDRMDIGVAEITQWHLERGFSTCGYHAIVRRSGVVEPGRAESKVGAHCQGHNRDSLGICWVGRDLPTPAQYTALLEKITEWCLVYGVPAERVVGHREAAPLSGKTCPNLQMDSLRLLVKRRLAEWGRGKGH